MLRAFGRSAAHLANLLKTNHSTARSDAHMLRTFASGAVTTATSLSSVSPLKTLNAAHSATLNLTYSRHFSATKSSAAGPSSYMGYCQSPPKDKGALWRWQSDTVHANNLHRLATYHWYLPFIILSVLAVHTTVYLLEGVSS